MDGMKIQRIHDILLGDMRPWHKDNVSRPEYYWTVSIEKETPDTISKYMYEMKVSEWLFFTSRLRYYRRVVDNAINKHLYYVAGVLKEYQHSTCLVLYMLKNTYEWIRSYIHTANHELGRYGLMDNDVIGEDVDFNIHREEKEFFILLRYIIASLVKCYLEIQSQYQGLMANKRIFDIDSFYSEMIGRRPCKIFPLYFKSKTSINVIPNCCFKYTCSSVRDFNDDIKTLHESLLDYGWIDSSTTEAMLIDLFSGKGCMHTIKWLGSPGILQKIIKPWIKDKVITVYPDGIGHWPVVSKRFIDKDGYPMKELGKENTNQKRNQSKIDDVVKILTKKK